MDKQKKTLLCMYVDDFCGIKGESFNFYIERRYSIEKGRISRKSDEEIEGFPKYFWGINGSKTNVSAVTLLIGENGAGKTTLMRLLIKWLCQLSVGNIPQEKGALVISVDGEDKLIAFDGGKPWTIEINKNDKIVYIEDKGEIKELLSDTRLAYYTDTMTDLELSDTLTEKELEFLHDDSLLTRLSKLMERKYTVDSVKNCINREEFERQMKLFLYSQDDPNILPEFPLRYMKFTALNAGNEKSFRVISDGNSELIEEASNLWKNLLAGNTNINNLPDIVKALLWGLFSGTITSLIRWERTLPNLKEGIVIKQIKSSLRVYYKYNYYDGETFFKRFFKNIFNDCAREFRAVHRYEEFSTEWEEQFKYNINSFLDALLNIENVGFWNKWTPSENTQNVWEFKLEYFSEKDENENKVLKEWRSLWECYLAVAHLMPGCRFDWKYASSGGKNQSNLYINLFNTVEICNGIGINQLWLLLDEPDNTFHPDWERRIIWNLLKTCSIFNINFQLLISTHSPIMLSDVPKQAAIFLKTGEKEEKGEKEEGEKEKQQRYPEASPFGQQIYTLFNDAFFMEQGIVGAFADEKIGKVYEGLYDIEEQVLSREKIQIENKLKDFEHKLIEYESIIKLIEEPLLHGHLSQSYKLCKQRMNELQ